MKAKILVIDDEQAICDLLKRFLTKRGYEVTVANSAEEGISKLEGEKPEVVLMDIRMPGMNGIEAVKKIRDIDEKVGIIMATAVLDERMAKEAIDLGASDYIIKPFDLDYLEKTLLVKLTMIKASEED